MNARQLAARLGVSQTVARRVLAGGVLPGVLPVRPDGTLDEAEWERFAHEAIHGWRLDYGRQHEGVPAGRTGPAD